MRRAAGVSHTLCSWDMSARVHTTWLIPASRQVLLVFKGRETAAGTQDAEVALRQDYVIALPSAFG